jgi:hypothetical protein
MKQKDKGYSMCLSLTKLFIFWQVKLLFLIKAVSDVLIVWLLLGTTQIYMFCCACLSFWTSVIDNIFRFISYR